MAELQNKYQKKLETNVLISGSLLSILQLSFSRSLLWFCDMYPTLTNVLKTGPVSLPEKGPGGRVTSSTAGEQGTVMSYLY